jgi:hypothetical protein
VSEERTIAADYRREDTAQVIAALLTLAAALGDLLTDLRIVGGLVPSMICEAVVDPSALDDGAHVGTNDLDVALEVSVLDDEHYKEIASRLRAKDFRPDVLRRWPAGIEDVAGRMEAHASRDPELVSEMLGLLDREFSSDRSQGPRATSRFHGGAVDEERVADAYGAVRDFLDACRRRGVRWPEPADAA